MLEPVEDPCDSYQTGPEKVEYMHLKLLYHFNLPNHPFLLFKPPNTMSRAEWARLTAEKRIMRNYWERDKKVDVLEDIAIRKVDEDEAVANTAIEEAKKAKEEKKAASKVDNQIK